MSKLAAATFLIGTVLSALSACNNSHNAASTTSDDIAIVVKSTPVETECAVVKGVDEILSDKTPPIIIVGEAHGYKGAPSLVRALLCQANKQGLEPHLALEFSRDNEIHARNFIKSNGSQADYRTILSDSRWLSLSDGRHTSATFGLLEYLQALPRGEKIDVSYFVPSSKETKALNSGVGFAKNYEIALADNLKSIFQRYNPDKMIVLSGNLHAMRGEARFGGATYLTMANHFSPKEAVTLNTSNILDSQFNITLTPDVEGRYDGTYGVENDDAAPAVPSPFR